MLAREGDVLGATRMVDRLAALPKDGSAGRSEELLPGARGAVAEAKGLVDTDLLTAIHHFAGGTSIDPYLQARHYERVGHPMEALALYREVVAGELFSFRTSWSRWADAYSALRVAELVIDTDPAEARAALAAFDREWPATDADHPLVLRANEVRVRVSAQFPGATWTQKQ